MANKKFLKSIAYALMAAGTANFLLGDLFNYNPMDELLGKDSAAAWVIYAVVGMAALYVLYHLVASLRSNKR